MKKTSFRKGFSLVELLVVVTIIAILSVVAYTAVSGQTAKARDARRTNDLASIQSALEIYYIKEGVYPAPTAGDAIDTSLLTAEFISIVPSDPKAVTPGQQYVYVTANSNQEYLLATALENGSDPDTAYVITKGTTVALASVDAADAPCNVVNEGTCLPYLVTAP